MVVALALQSQNVYDRFSTSGGRTFFLSIAAKPDILLAFNEYDDLFLARLQAVNVHVSRRT
jgi:hypothetical protein